MHAIIASDVHAGYHGSNLPAFLGFLDHLPPSLDHLILLGDIWEMWRRDIVGVLASNMPLVDRLRNLNATITLVAGNHDWHLVNIGDPRSLPPWFRAVEEVTLDLGNRQARLLHGHQFDPSNNRPRVNEWLCHTTNDNGGLLSDLYEDVPAARALADGTSARLGIGPLNRAQIIRGAYVHGTAAPGLEHRPDRVNLIRARARASRQEHEVLIHGHTHVPHQEPGYFDTGSWVRDQNTYVEVLDNHVTLKTWP